MISDEVKKHFPNVISGLILSFLDYYDHIESGDLEYCVENFQSMITIRDDDSSDDDVESYRRKKHAKISIHYRFFEAACRSDNVIMMVMFTDKWLFQSEVEEYFKSAFLVGNVGPIEWLMKIFPGETLQDEDDMVLENIDVELFGLYLKVYNPKYRLVYLIETNNMPFIKKWVELGRPLDGLSRYGDLYCADLETLVYVYENCDDPDSLYAIENAICKKVDEITLEPDMKIKIAKALVAQGEN